MAVYIALLVDYEVACMLSYGSAILVALYCELCRAIEGDIEAAINQIDGYC